MVLMFLTGRFLLDCGDDDGAGDDFDLHWLSLSASFSLLILLRERDLFIFFIGQFPTLFCALLSYR